MKLGISLACSAALLIAMNVQAAEKNYSIGGDLELDLTTKHPSDTSSDFGTGGRVKLNATGEIKGDNYFIKGVGQVLLGVTGNGVGYDDVYFQFGRDVWDVQIGRFEGVSGFGKGKDTLVENAGGVPVYEANAARGRFSDGAIHTALNLKGRSTSFQLGVVAGKDGATTVTGVRPAITFSRGGSSLTAVVESMDNEEANGGAGLKTKGFGLNGALAMGGGTLGVSVAKGTGEVIGNPDVDTTSLALNYTRGQWGVGYIYSEQDIAGVSDDPSVNTFYGAYTIPLFGRDDASMTLAASTSKADNVATDDTVNAARLRFNYTF